MYYKDSFVNFIKRPKPSFQDTQTEFQLDLSSFTFIDRRIYQDIKATIKKSVIRTFEWDGQKVQLIWAYPGALDPKKLDFFFNCVSLFISFFARPTIPKSLVLYLIDYNRPKRIVDNNALTAFNVNSGFSSPDMVVVYRREEMVKVLMHELIHFYDRDAKNKITPDQENFFNVLFKIKCKSVIINECFTDTLACLVNTYLYSIIEGNGDLSTFAKNLKKEQAFIFQQAHKVLHLNKYFIEDNILKRHGDVCEQTNVTSYYILKALLFLDIDKFIDYLKINEYSLNNVNMFITLLHTQCKDIHKLFEYPVKTKSLKFSSLDITKLRGRPKTI